MDRERAASELGKARAGERVTFEYRVVRPTDGLSRLLRNAAFPIRDAAGRITRIGGVGRDATEELRTYADVPGAEKPVSPKRFGSATPG